MSRFVFSKVVRCRCPHLFQTMMSVLEKRVTLTIITLFLLLVGCQGAEPPPKVSLSKRLIGTSPLQNIALGQPLRVAIAGVVSP